MAERIATAIQGHAVFVAKAGTGTGKTFAYLVPALQSGGKVIVSTCTDTLQDQLFNKDIPMVREALRAPVRVALLKGRANYVCPYHLEHSLNDGRFLSREDAADARRIAHFAKVTKTGDKAECLDVSENSPVWNAATSTRDNCLGQDCPDYKECFVMLAGREAMAADLVVVNHHLFFADVMLRDEGMAELLPACNTVIFDEAHQLPEVATLRTDNGTDTDRKFNDPTVSIAALFAPWQTRIAFRKLICSAEPSPAGPRPAEVGRPWACWHEPPRDKPEPLPRSRPSLPGDALVEFIVRCWLGQEVSFPLDRPGHQQLPQRRATGRRQTRCGGRLTQVAENLTSHRAFIDEGDDPHVAATLRADEWQHFVDAPQQERPDVACSLAVGSLLAHIV